MGCGLQVHVSNIAISHLLYKSFWKHEKTVEPKINIMWVRKTMYNPSLSDADPLIYLRVAAPSTLLLYF